MSGKAKKSKEPFTIDDPVKEGGVTVFNVIMDIKPSLVDYLKTHIHKKIMELSEEEQQSMEVRVHLPPTFPNLWKDGIALPQWSPSNPKAFRLFYGPEALQLYERTLPVDNQLVIALLVASEGYVLCHGVEGRRKSDGADIRMLDLPAASYDRSSKSWLDVIAGLCERFLGEKVMNERPQPRIRMVGGSTAKIECPATFPYHCNRSFLAFALEDLGHGIAGIIREKYKEYNTVADVFQSDGFKTGGIYLVRATALKNAIHHETTGILKAAIAHYDNPMMRTIVKPHLDESEVLF